MPGIHSPQNRAIKRDPPLQTLSKTGASRMHQKHHDASKVMKYRRIRERPLHRSSSEAKSCGYLHLIL